MKKKIIAFMLALSLGCTTLFAQILRHDISLSDPFVMADAKTNRYYMTGTGGRMWISADMETWTGPTSPISTTEATWMGATPQIWASEVYRYNDMCYNISTFTNSSIKIDADGHPRRAVHILQGKLPNGTYSVIPDGDDIYLPAEKTTLDGTLFIDTDGTPYLVYCHEWIQNGNGTIEYIKLKNDLSGSIGTGTVMMRAKDASWNTSPVTDGPFLFRTQTGRLGMIWTSWHGEKYVQGVAYSTSGKISGPWQQQPLPITPNNYGHGMLFRDFNGQLLMSIHSHRTIDASIQKWERHPVFFIMDDSGNELKTVMEYRAKIDLQHPTNVMVDNEEFDYGKNGWTSNTTAQNQRIASNQGGTIVGNFFESWDANSFTGEIYQQRNVPNGTYRLTASVFRSYPISGGTADAQTVKLFANANTTTINSATPEDYSVTVYVTDGKIKFGIRSDKKNFQWMGIDNVRLQYYGEQNYSQEEIDAVDLRVYFRNTTTGKFLNAGQSWGTKALLGEHPLDFELVEMKNGRFAIDSKISNGGGNHYLNSNGYVDAEMMAFRVTPTEGKGCTLSHDGTHYWGCTSSGNLTNTLTSKLSALSQWEMLSFEDLMQELKYAWDKNPVDATFLIDGPNFGRNDTRINSWKGTALTRGGNVTNMCAEAPSTDFDIFQNIKGIPNGIYELRAQGFYRDGDAQNAANRKNAGTENIRAFLYANNASTPLCSIFDAADDSHLSSDLADDTQQGKIPANLEGASALFSAGLYQLTLRVKVEDGNLKIGVKKTAANSPESNWTVFDNFELYYLGDPASDINNVNDNFNLNSGKNLIYDLSGRIVNHHDISNLKHGVYIINGKKVIF